MNENVERIIKHPATIPTVVGVATFAAGFAGGFFYGRRRGVNEMIDIFTDETNETVEEVENPNQLKLTLDADKLSELERFREEQAKELNGETTSYISVDKDEGIDVDEVVIRHTEPAPEAVSEIDVDPETCDIEDDDTVEDDTASITVNGTTRITAFAESGDNWEFHKELESRDPEKPYIVHRDEFLDDEAGLAQSTLTYYVGDDIMVDEQNQPIFNWGAVVGPLKWGHGSEDPNVFYVRNEKRHAEYEVLRHTGTYQYEVLGIEEELPEEVPAVRKFREQDD